MPHTLRSMKFADNEVAELTMLCGFDEDLAGQITQISNHIRGPSRATSDPRASQRVSGEPPPRVSRMVSTVGRRSEGRRMRNCLYR